LRHSAGEHLIVLTEQVGPSNPKLQVQFGRGWGWRVKNALLGITPEKPG
jgi:hypothetical protein